MAFATKLPPVVDAPKVVTLADAKEGVYVLVDGAAILLIANDNSIRYMNEIAKAAGMRVDREDKLVIEEN